MEENVKVSLEKEERMPLAPVAVVDGCGSSAPIPVETDGDITKYSGALLLNGIEKGVRSLFGNAVDECPMCHRVICICSLRNLFTGGDTTGL